MKRYRAVDVPPKYRRTAKGRNTRLGDSFYFSRFFSAYNLVYLKFFLMWVCCIALDFLIGFRFELLWPVWLLVRHLYESFRVHAFSSSLNYSAFSVFFVCVTATSDLVCYLFIPIQVLIFLASTYVWVQFVYQSSDRGVCLPSLFLWALFIVFEYSVRYRFDNATWYLTRTSWITAGLFPSTADSVSIGLSANSSSSSSPSSTRLELYRPFAAHCIGFPVVTLGFRVKSFLSNWRIRVRREEVTRQNEFFERLLADAIPTAFENRKHFISSRSQLSADQQEVLEFAGRAICPVHLPGYIPATNGSVGAVGNHQLQHQHETDNSSSNTTNNSECSLLRENAQRLSEIRQLQKERQTMKMELKNARSAENELRLQLTNAQQRDGGGGIGNHQMQQKQHQQHQQHELVDNPGSNNNNNNNASTPNNNSECSLLRENAQRLSEIRQLQKERQTLELSFDKMKVELKNARSAENELRLQLTNAQQREQCCREEWKQFEREQKQRMDHLETKSKQLSKQNDYYKLSTQALERRVGELQLKKSEIERELTNERLRNSTRDDSMGKQQQHASDNGELKQKLANQDRELKTLRKDIKAKAEQCTKFDEELRQLRSAKSDGNKQMDSLRQKIAILEQTLSSENKLKQDLFRALNDSKAEIAALKARLHSTQSSNGFGGGATIGLNSSSGSSPTVLQQQQRQFSAISQQKSLTPPPLSVGSSTINSTLEQLLHATQNMSYSLSTLDSNGSTNGIDEDKTWK